MVMEFESTYVVITTVLLLLVDIDIADNILVCFIIKRNLQARYVQDVKSWNKFIYS